MKEYKLKINSNTYTVVIKDVTEDAVLAEVNGKQYLVDRAVAPNSTAPGSAATNVPQPAISAPKPATAASTAKTGSGTIPTPIPGQIISISVTVGEKVRSGQKLLVLEAMKLENSITATMDGTVEEILVSEGDVVAQGQTLVVLK